MRATKIRDLSAGVGTLTLWQMSPPHEGHEYVVSSAIGCAFDTGRPETYLFPSNEKGDITDWVEMAGSFQGSADHDRAITGAGYEVVS